MTSFKIYDWDGSVARWFTDLRSRGRVSFAGGEMVMAKPGSDNVASVDRLLTELVSAGVIERGGSNPTRDLLFFGAAGLSASDIAKHPENAPPCWFQYRILGDWPAEESR
jgi:hypothetical protein